MKNERIVLYLSVVLLTKQSPGGAEGRNPRVYVYVCEHVGISQAQHTDIRIKQQIAKLSQITPQN